MAGDQCTLLLCICMQWMREAQHALGMYEYSGLCMPWATPLTALCFGNMTEEAPLGYPLGAG